MEDNHKGSIFSDFAVNFRMAFSIGEEFYTACYQGDIPRARNGMRNGADINFTCR